MDGSEHRQIRRSLNISQERWGEIVNVHRAAVSDWERGVYPVPVPIELLLNLLKNDNRMIFELQKMRGLT